MSLRSRILALTVGVAASVLVLFAVPLVLLLRQAAVEDAQQDAIDVAQGVADYISTGDVDASELNDFVDRINDRDDSYPVEVVAADGTSIGTRLPDLDESDSDGDDLGGGSDDDGDDDEYGELRSTSQAQVRSVDGGDLVRHSGRLVCWADHGQWPSHLPRRCATRSRRRSRCSPAPAWCCC